MKMRILVITALFLLTVNSTLSSKEPTLDVSGSWSIYYYDETNSEDSMELTQEGDVLTGTWRGEDVQDPIVITGSIDDVTVTIKVPIPDVPCRIVASLSPDDETKLEGDWIVDSGQFAGTHPWRAEKKVTDTEKEVKTNESKPDPPSKLTAR